ncbi:hypothetical protein TNCV_875471 [Trichonephila clavipes]|nr:hypothetical protein TNCV_875471 [Trichonephila clavipes]
MSQNLCRFQMSQNHLCRFQISHNHLCRFQISHNHLCRFQMSHNHLCRFPQSRHFEARPFGADGCTRTAHVALFESPAQELQLLHTVPSVFDASKYGGLPFGSNALHVTSGRVLDLVDVVGGLGNASRRETNLSYGMEPTLETGFGNTCRTLASESFGPWDAL